MMFQKFLIALGVCVAVTVGLFYAKENGERSGSRPLGHLWSLFHLFGDQCETNSKTSLTSRPQEVFSSSHQLPCYRIHRRLVIVGREQMPVAIHRDSEATMTSEGLDSLWCQPRIDLR